MVSTAARVGSINVLLQTQLGPGVAGLNAFANAVDRTGTTVDRRVASMDRSIVGLNSTLGRLNTRGLTSLSLSALRAGTALDQLRGLALAAGVAVGGIAPAAIAAGMIRTTDAAHRMSNQLRTVTTDAADLKSTQDALFEVAQRSRSTFDGTVTIYARTARAVEHLNMKQKDLLRLTETVQKAFAVGGATTAEAWGGAIQLSQGIASNRFSGDEFRSVAENAPVLLQGMAKNLGVTIGKLREMAHAGELTADVVVKAIIGASQEIDNAFAKTTSTIEQAWTKVGNAVTKFAMDSENASAASDSLVFVLNALATNIDTVADSLLLLGVGFASVFGGRQGSAAIAGMANYIASLKAARLESLATAEAAKKAATAEALAAATRARELRQGVIATSRGRKGELGEMRAGMLAANAQKAAAAEQQFAAAAQKAGDIRAAADAKAAAAKADATQKWSQFMAVARQEKKEAISSARAALTAAEAQKVATQTRLAGARSYYEMSKAAGVSQKTQIKAGKDLQAALQADLRATQGIATAQGSLQAALDGTANKSRAYLAAQKAVEAAKKQVISTTAAAAAAELKHTEAVAAHAAAQRTAQAAIVSGNLTKEQEAALNKRAEVLERRVASAKAQSATATLAARDAAKAATAATVQLASAQQAATARAMAWAAAGRAASAAWAFVGGPLGVAMLALGGIMYLQSRNAAYAAQTADDYAAAIKKAGEESAGAAGGIRKASEELTKAEQAASNAGAAVTNMSLSVAQGQWNDSITRMRMLASSMRGVVDTAVGFNSMTFSPVAAEIDNLITRFEKGEISAEELRAEIDRIASANPDNSAVLARIQEIGDQADAARGRVEGLRASLQDALGELRSVFLAFSGEGSLGKTGRLKPDPLADDRFNSRFGQPYAKNWKELFPEWYKKEKAGRAPRKTADDRFDNSIQSIRDRISAMQEEQAALRLSFREQQQRKIALDLEQEALKQVREEARRKGEQDWQNAQLAPDQIKRIEEVSRAYADQADQLRRDQEVFDLQRDVLKGAFSDLRSDLEDGKLDWKDLGDIALNALDKIIDKIENDLIDAILQANSAADGGGGGLFGWLTQGIGSLLGLGGGLSLSPAAAAVVSSGGMTGLFDSGGVQLGTGIAPFGPKTRPLGNAVLADSGFGARHFPAVLEQGEAVLTENMMDRTMNVIGAATSALREGGSRAYNDNRVFKIDARGAQQGVGAEIRRALEEYDRHVLPQRVNQISADPRAMG